MSESDVTPARSVCENPGCGAIMEQPAGGRPRKVCSNACRQEMYRRRKEAAERAAARAPRGYSWKQFEPGNTVSLTHGMYSSRVPALVAEEARGLRERLAAEFPILGHDMFAEAFERATMEMARAKMMLDWAWDVVEGRRQARKRKGFPRTGFEAVPQATWDQISKAQSNAQKFAQDCGLDPIGFARLAKELGWAKQLNGQAVDSLAARGRALRRGGGD